MHQIPTRHVKSLILSVSFKYWKRQFTRLAISVTHMQSSARRQRLPEHIRSPGVRRQGGLATARRKRGQS